MPGYSTRRHTQKAGIDVFFDDKLVCRYFKNQEFNKFLQENDIDWKSKISRRLLPDNALWIIVRETLFIVEIKFQEVEGSVDEKLQGCDFKRKQYLELVSVLGLKVEYVYVLNDWFQKPKYRDVLHYINSVNCHYVFNELPLGWLCLPTREKQ